MLVLSAGDGGYCKDSLCNPRCGTHQSSAPPRYLLHWRSCSGLCVTFTSTLTHIHCDLDLVILCDFELIFVYLRLSAFHPIMTFTLLKILLRSVTLTLTYLHH